MDDGTKCTNGGYSLATCSFSIEEINIFQKFLKDKFNLNTSLHKDNILYIKKESANIFENIIKPYIIDSMKYKLHKS